MPNIYKSPCLNLVMGVAAVKFKIMPSSPDANLEEIEKSISEILEKENVRNPNFSIEPIAFGLKAIIVFFGWPEEKELESLEEKLKLVKDVNSVDLIDLRRAIG